MGTRLLLVLLCVTVVTWGLRAKLSLYHSVSFTDSASTKLIQDKQVCVKVGYANDQRVKHFRSSVRRRQAFWSFVGTPMLGPLQIDPKVLEIGNSVESSVFQHPTSQSIRPPPSVL